jgi:hypothetical protein
MDDKYFEIEVVEKYDNDCINIISINVMLYGVGG